MEAPRLHFLAFPDEDPFSPACFKDSALPTPSAPFKRLSAASPFLPVFGLIQR